MNSRWTIDHEALLECTRTLVRTPSVNAPEHGWTEAAAAELVAEQMRSFDWEPQVDEVAPGRPNVIAVLDGGLPGRTLLFEGHTDVVTEGSPDLWTVDPFGAEIRAGRLYGRGAADMKSGVASMLFAADAVARAGDFPGRIVVAALADEEGMMLGAKHFVATGLASQVDAAIICEPEGGEVCVAHKGALRLRLDVTGRMSHGAMPQHGINPAPALASFIQALERLQTELGERDTAYPAVGPTYLTPTVIQAGEAQQLNVIPGRAWLAVDVRTIPGVDHAELVRRLESDAAEIAAATGTGLQLSVIEDRPATETDRAEPIVRAVCEAHALMTGQPAPIGCVPGATDGTILWRDLGIPVVVCGPGDKWIAHQADEYVEIAEIELYAHVYAEAANRFLRLGS